MTLWWFLRVMDVYAASICVCCSYGSMRCRAAIDPRVVTGRYCHQLEDHR